MRWLSVLFVFFSLTSVRGTEVNREEYTCEQIRWYFSQNTRAQIDYIVAQMTEEEKDKALSCFGWLQRKILVKRYRQ